MKPEAALDELLWDLGQTTGMPVFQAFVMLWCHADREGRFEWRPRALKAGCLPFWEGDFATVLDALEKDGFVLRYTVDGKTYGLVRTFKLHQAINQREAQSVIPAPDAVATDGVQDTCMHMQEMSPRARVRAGSVPVPIPVPFQEGGEGGNFERREEARSEPRATMNGHSVYQVPQDAPETPPSASNEAPRNLAEALTLPPRQRAGWVERDPSMADWLEPNRWPEVQQVAVAWGEPRVGVYRRDTGVQAVVALLAAGFTLEELLSSVPRIRDSDWAKGKKLGMSSMSLAVVRTALGERAGKATAEDLLEKLEASRHRSAKEEHAKAARQRLAGAQGQTRR